MNNKKLTGVLSLLIITSLSFTIGCNKPHVIDNNDLRDFQQVNLVANSSEYNPVTVDHTLLNAFGIAWSPNGIAWVNSVGGHVSELYTAEGAIARSPVNIPSPADTIGGFPCGIVFSGGKGFNLPNGPSLFLFSGFDGVISGWNPASGNNAQRLRNPPGASYTGLAIGASGGHNFIYGANFGAKKIDVWDTAFNRVTMTFKDPTLPDTYSPYNIQAVGDFLFVMYAELATSGPNAGHGVAGAGKGFVSVFKTDGSFVKRFASRGTLNVPWGVTMAPANFLEDQDMDSDDHGENHPNGNNDHELHDPRDPVILVGNFGDGHINVYSVDGQFLGQLQTHNNHHPVVIDGLWALSFAPSGSGVDPNRLYFTAGPDHESDGVFGYLVKR
ncbi:MAG: TIGR03118 family protein [Bacteroidota bacterium]|nr:TIGR03118 family protein [Bacteroidota bacterium]